MDTPPKTFRTYEQQVELLISRGMHVPDKIFASHQLKLINYYRLSGYWYPFRVKATQHVRYDSFINGTDFMDVLRLYDFDARLRIATFSALSDIELWLRANLGYRLGQIHQYAHLEPEVLEIQNHKRQQQYSRWVSKYERELSNSKEDFVKHHRGKYSGRLPVWAAVEVLDWGALTYLFSFSPRYVKEAIADSCELSVPQFESWLKSLNAVRNTAAHHGRLFNRSHALRPKLPATGASITIDAIRQRSNKTFAMLSLIQYLRQAMGIGPSSMLIKSIEHYPLGIAQMPLSVTGAPTDWRELDLWKLEI